MVLCDHLEGWEGDARGRRYGDVCICIADSLCYKEKKKKGFLEKMTIEIDS